MKNIGQSAGLDLEVTGTQYLSPAINASSFYRFLSCESASILYRSGLVIVLVSYLEVTLRYGADIWFVPYQRMKIPWLRFEGIRSNVQERQPLLKLKLRSCIPRETGSCTFGTVSKSRRLCHYT